MYRMIWRWHFYAGLFCLPFIVLLSATGAIYLFKPQIEAAQDRAYAHVGDISGLTPATPSTQVEAALAAVIPDSVLNAYQLPTDARAAAQVLVGRGDQVWRVYVDPWTLSVRAVKREDGRLMRQIFHLHGELMLGDRGSMLVELAASWAIVLVLTGLYLWWPRQQSGLAGIVYPRLFAGTQTRWRDLHAVTAFWISGFVLLLLISGLPWAKSWGSLLKEVRQWSSPAVVSQDWSTGRSSELSERRAMNTQAAPMPEMDGMDMGGHTHHMHGQALPMTTQDYRPLDRLVEVVAPMGLAGPVLLTPPSARSATWRARSDAGDRTRRTTLRLDPQDGRILSRRDFADQPFLDRLIGTGVSLHEGRLFGWPNQLLGLLTALGLQLMAISAVAMWWRRRPAGVLGAPLPQPGSARVGTGLVVVILLLCVLLPLLGLSLLTLTALEYAVLSRHARTAAFLGLTPR